MSFDEKKNELLSVISILKEIDAIKFIQVLCTQRELEPMETVRKLQISKKKKSISLEMQMIHYHHRSFFDYQMKSKLNGNVENREYNRSNVICATNQGYA